MMLIFSVIASLMCMTTVTSTHWNWMSMSLGSFRLQNCREDVKQEIIGSFQTCLALGRGKRSLYDLLSDKQKPEKTRGYDGNWGSNWGGDWGSNWDGGVSEDIESPGDQWTGGQNQYDPSQWPKSLCSSLKQVVKCMPKILNARCLTDKERDFFESLERFHETQQDVACDSPDDIYENHRPLNCANDINVNVATRCYNQIHNTYNWRTWRLNFEDGRMCKYWGRLRDCELKNYKNCGTKVTNFVRSIWDKPTQETPCGRIDVSSTTTTKLPTTTTTRKTTTTRPVSISTQRTTTTTKRPKPSTTKVPNGDNCDHIPANCANGFNCLRPIRRVLGEHLLNDSNTQSQLAASLCNATAVSIECHQREIYECGKYYPWWAIARKKGIIVTLQRFSALICGHNSISLEDILNQPFSCLEWGSAFLQLVNVN